MTSAIITKSGKAKYSYGDVVLSADNCILPPEKLSPTPSFLDGLDSESETDLRILCCEMIQTSGVLLRLPQTAAAAAQVLFQRFYYSRSFIKHRMDFVTMACVVLASKIEEEPRRIQDVINVFHHIEQMKCGMVIQPLLLDQSFLQRKECVIRAERQLLKDLGFCVHVKHPQKFIVTVLEILNLVNNRQLLQTAWNYANDGLRSDVYLRYQPETIACACIYLSARMHQVPLPTQPAWYLVFGATEEEIHNICHTIFSLYARKKPDAEKLQNIVMDLVEESKLRAQALSSRGKTHSVKPVTVPPDRSVQPVVESTKEKNSGCGDVSGSCRTSINIKRDCSPGDRICSHAKNYTRSGSSYSLPDGGSHLKRHRHGSSSRSHKKPRRSESVSPYRKRDYRKRNYSPTDKMSTHGKKYSNSSYISSDVRHYNRSPSRNYKRPRRSESVSPYKKKHSGSRSSDNLSSRRYHLKKRQHRSNEKNYVRPRSSSKSKSSRKSNHHSSIRTVRKYGCG